MSDLFDRSVSVAGRTYDTLKPDIADYPERLSNVEEQADDADSTRRLYIHLGQISSKASDAAVARAPAPVDGRIVSIHTVLNGALATGDATFTAKIGSTAVTGAVATATQSGSAAGDVDSGTATAANTFVRGNTLSVTAGGASTATATADVYLLVAY